MYPLSVFQSPIASVRIATIFVSSLLLSSSLLAAPPTIVGNDFETIFGMDDTISGSQGGSSVNFEIYFSNDLNRFQLGSDDLVCEGQTGDASGKSIDVTFEFSYFSTIDGISVIVGRYKLGPFDETANGTYSLKIVADQIVSNSGDAIAAGEILLFTQDVNNPMPDVLDVRFDPPLVGGNLEGPLGFERPKMIVDFNKDVATNTFGGTGIEIVGTGGSEGLTITLVPDYPISELEDKITVEYFLGPVDVANNGTYKVNVIENTIRGIGDTLNYVPAQEIAAFTQNITNPPPRVLAELNGSPLPTELGPSLDYEGHEIRVYFNYVVDTNEIDEKDIRVVGISENNAGVELSVISGFGSSSNFAGNDAYTIANYWVVGGGDAGDPFDQGFLTEALNGDWEVQIVEGEILDRENPPRALAPGVLGTYNQEVVDPFRFIAKGRVYEDDRNDPRLIDDGDPGLDVDVRLEQFLGAGLSAGYQDIGLWGTTRNSFSTCLVFPITDVVAGGAGAGSFTVAEDGSGQFQTGDMIEVVDSTGNNGIYTVSSVNTDFNAGTSIIEVEEAVGSGVADGSVTKTFTAEVVIDDVTIPLSFKGTEVPTFEVLIEKVNDALGGAGFIRFAGFDQERLRIESATLGDTSSVLITESDDRAALFSSVAKNGGGGAFFQPEPGGDGLMPGYQDVGLFSSFAMEDPSGLVLPITQVVMGGAGSGSFSASGDLTGSFKVGDKFSVVGSSENNGLYTVKSTTVQFSWTIIEVDEAVPSATIDGSISRTYAADVTVDGNLVPLSFSGTEVDTFANLLTKLNEALGDSATAFLFDPFNIRIESATQGDDSSVAISESDEVPGLFSNLKSFNYFPPSVRGSDNETEGFHDVSLNAGAFLTEPSGLVSLPILSASAEGSFTIDGDHTQPIQWFDPNSTPFAPGDVISVIGSANNAGPFTVNSVSLVDGDTRVGVDEAVAATGAEGTITKTYVGEVIIDEVRIPLSVLGSDGPTFADLINELNDQLDGAGTVSMTDGFGDFRITSATDGIDSSVFITEPGGRTDLFASLIYATGLGIPERGGDGWGFGNFNGQNEYLFVGEEDYGNLLFTIVQPGQYRLRATGGEVWDPETQFNTLIDPIPEWIEQAVGDPTRGGIKDHRMYFDVTADQEGQMRTINFSYVLENDSPEAIEDDGEFDLAFRVPWNSVEYVLDVLKNDTVDGAPAGPGDLTIIGLSPGRAISTEMTSNGSRQFSTITTDGDVIYYTPWANFTGWELFYYTIEDKDGKRDFAPVYILVTSSPIQSELFTLNDRFQALPNSSNNLFNVVGNDFLSPSGSNSELMITGLGAAPGSTSKTGVGSEGGSVSTTDDRNVIYTPPTNFEGTEIFYYNISDGGSKMGFAQVVVSVIPDETELNPAIDSYSSELARMMSRTEQGRRILDLIERFAPELFAIVIGDPEIGGEVASLAQRLGIDVFSGSLAGRSRINTLEVGAGGEVLKTFDALQEGLASFVNGSGSEVLLTQEIVDQTVALRDMIYEEASDELKAEIDAELGDLESKVGDSFDEFLETFGVDSADTSLILYNPFRGQTDFSVSVRNLEGFVYTLWKSPSLRPDDWMVVEDATIEYLPKLAVITDPNPGGRAFYRLERKVDTGE